MSKSESGVCENNDRLNDNSRLKSVPPQPPQFNVVALGGANRLPNKRPFLQKVACTGKSTLRPGVRGHNTGKHMFYKTVVIFANAGL